MSNIPILGNLVVLAAQQNIEKHEQKQGASMESSSSVLAESAVEMAAGTEEWEERNCE